jgi:hypothetical protein
LDGLHLRIEKFYTTLPFLLKRLFRLQPFFSFTSVSFEARRTFASSVQGVRMAICCFSQLSQVNAQGLNVTRKACASIHGHVALFNHVIPSLTFPR